MALFEQSLQNIRKHQCISFTVIPHHSCSITTFLFSMLKTYTVIFKCCSGQVYLHLNLTWFPNMRKSQHIYYINKILWSQFYPAHKKTPQIHCARLLNPRWCISSAACPHFTLCPAPVLSHQALCRSIRAAAASHTHLQLAPIGQHYQAPVSSKGAPGPLWAAVLPDCLPTCSIHQESCPTWAGLSCIKTHHGCSSNADGLVSPGQTKWAFTGPQMHADGAG